MSHELMMARALILAERGVYTTAPNPRVGCVIAKNDQILAEGWHQKAGQPHAEVNALEQLDRQGLRAVQGADCYITLEPCSHEGRTPPCADALIKAGIKRAFVAMVDPNPLVSGQGVKKLQQAGIIVTTGLLEHQAEALNRGFCQRMRHNRPFVRSKIAISLDGRTAMASGESQWITSPQARQDVQKLRAQCGAIVTGIGTVLADDPQMTVRPGQWYPENQPIRQPLRIVVDSQFKISSRAKIFSADSDTLIATVSNNKRDNIATIKLDELSGHINLNQLMMELGNRDINDVLIEAGAVLNGAMLELGLIDELIIYMAPKILGDSGKGAFHIPALKTMADNIDLTISDIRAVGQDWRITAKPEYRVRS
ncbi:MAG: diaminohydroxyphosphoribosylaminopyrimidine deaminase [Methylophagaceae bacterium]|jgi:diaminohydroxyphosphoribosylaminopyrimidine deaminase/5-amino-6-(5-phosphoribosylamino)uracil reductase